jgi:hypothetical protein
MNDLFLDWFVFNSFDVSVFSNIVNKFISINIWNVFSLIFNWDIFGLSFFMRNIFDFIDGIILSEGFFEWDVFHSRTSLINLIVVSFNISGSNNLVSLDNSESWSLLDNLGSHNGLDNLRSLVDNLAFNWFLDNSLNGLLDNLHGLLNVLYWLLDIRHSWLDNSGL